LGFDPQYGGRPVKRVLQQFILNPLSKALLAGTLKQDKTIKADYYDESFVFINS
jgi:ATP-dependent Clp protease ATP-binding subunit ClpB